MQGANKQTNNQKAILNLNVKHQAKCNTYNAVLLVVRLFILGFIRSEEMSINILKMMPNSNTGFIYLFCVYTYS